MAAKVRVVAPRPVTIDLSALFGRFQVPGSDFVVRFASTFASKEAEGHRELLDELKPMRDRVDASAISDLTALLQRDLNDRRVAEQLIPYLVGTAQSAQTRIGFFPAVLAVLVPKGYLAQDADQGEEVGYPPPRENSEEGTVDYTGAGQRHFAWQVQPYVAEDGTIQPVGLLRINPHETEVVVLDGQHRSNAFRFLAGAFNPTNQIYEDFYKETERPAEFTADLPVTIIWFEAQNDARVRPRLISRQLFVDVNNNARPVSTARTILLNDRSLSAIATQALYNRAADARFEAGAFSLLHSAFDMDSDLADVALPAFALTSPEITEAAFLWLLLGSDRYTDLSLWTVDRVRAQRNRNRFIRQMGTAEDVSFGTEEDESAVQVAAPMHAERYRRLLDERVVPALWCLVSGLTLLGPHYRAAAATEEWVQHHAPMYERTAWDKIFKGGEGLYWTFRDRKVSDRNVYREASNTVERWFRQERAQNLGVDVQLADTVFKSFATKAFQIGFVMAADYLAEKNVAGGEVVGAAEELITALGRFSPQNWIVFFRELRPLVVRGETAPRIWPAYRNLLVRMFNEGRQEPLNDDIGLYPEQRAFHLALDALAERRAEDDDSLPESAEVARWVRNERDRIQAVFNGAGLTTEWFGEEATLERGRAYFHTKFESLQ